MLSLRESELDLTVCNRSLSSGAGLFSSLRTRSTSTSIEKSQKIKHEHELRRDLNPRQGKDDYERRRQCLPSHMSANSEGSFSRDVVYCVYAVFAPNPAQVVLLGFTARLDRSCSQRQFESSLSSLMRHRREIISQKLCCTTVTIRQNSIHNNTWRTKKDTKSKVICCCSAERTRLQTVTMSRTDEAISLPLGIGSDDSSE